MYFNLIDFWIVYNENSYTSDYFDAFHTPWTSPIFSSRRLRLANTPIVDTIYTWKYVLGFRKKSFPSRRRSAVDNKLCQKQNKQYLLLPDCKPKNFWMCFEEQVLYSSFLFFFVYLLIDLSIVFMYPSNLPQLHFVFKKKINSLCFIDLKINNKYKSIERVQNQLIWFLLN